MSKRNPSIDYEDLESEFDYANDASSSTDGGKSYRIQDDELWKKPRPGEIAFPDRKKARAVFDDEQSCFERYCLLFRTFYQERGRKNESWED